MGRHTFKLQFVTIKVTTNRNLSLFKVEVHARTGLLQHVFHFRSETDVREHIDQVLAEMYTIEGEQWVE
jgi:hypothetical protein